MAMTRHLSVLALFALGMQAAAGQTVEWVAGTSLAGTTFKTYMGEQVCIDLKIKGPQDQDLDVVKATVEKPGVYPYAAGNAAAAVFAYPHDEINFPASGALTAKVDFSSASYRTVDRQYCFTPEPGEECVYTVCFEGQLIANSGVPTGVVTATASCHRIEVHNSVLKLGGAGHKAEVASLSNLITPKDGLTVSAWVYPECDASPVARNESILVFGSNRNIATPYGADTGLDIRNAIMWQEDKNNQGSFFYYDCYSGAFFTTARFCCGSWHFVSFSIGEDNAGTLYVDGVGEDKLAVANSLEKLVTESVEFTTASRPDNGLDADDQGYFRLGESFKGYLDEVHVYNRGLSAPEVSSLASNRRPVGTVASLTMRPGNSTTPTLTGGAATIDMPYPVMVPCVMGMSHSVGPSDGSCPTEVFGWGFTDSVNPKVSFGGVEVRATYVNATTLTVETPGHISPRFVDVLASNDGVSFTDTAKVGKAAKHLYMESALYLTGQGNSGASADFVCLDLPTRAVTFGAWVCPKCGPPVPDAPPPPAAAAGR